MQLDVRIVPSHRMRADADLIAQAESRGFAGAWLTEQARNPFFPLTLAAKATSEIQLGAHQALAFPRSPMVTAQIAWDLARQSGGRFLLGLTAGDGSPTEGDKDEASGAGLRRMREYVESLRAIWHTFQTDARLRYRGEFYTFRLMAPFFNPGPIEHPDIPLFLAGNDPALASLAGELCQGFHVGALHTADYIRDVLRPALATGMKSGDRLGADCSLVVPLTVVSGFSDASIARERQLLKHRIAGAVGTAEFDSVIARQGWDFHANRKTQSDLERRDPLPVDRVPDDIIDEVAIVAPPEAVLARVSERYAGLVDRVCLEMNGENSALIQAIISSRSADF